MKRCDPFINVDTSFRNIDRWIVRTSIRDELRKRYPILSGTLLDVGCGMMPYRKEILASSEVSSYVGLDIEQALTYDVNVKPNATWDGVNMPFSNEEFDCVISTEVLEHVPDINQFLSEISRVLKKKGVFFFTTPFIWPYHEAPYDCQRWTSFGLHHHLAKQGFHSIDIVSIGNWHSALAQMLGLWGARAPLPKVLRRVIRFPIWCIQKLLCYFDCNSANVENSMPRMIVGTALS